MMTHLRCPYCSQPITTSKQLRIRDKVTCTKCSQVFFVNAADLADSADVPYVEHLHVKAAKDALPPPTMPAIRIVRQPELHGNFINWMESSRNAVKVMLGILGLGLLLVFIGWYTSQVEEIDTTAKTAARKRNTKIDQQSSAFAASAARVKVVAKPPAKQVTSAPPAKQVSASPPPAQQVVSPPPYTTMSLPKMQPILQAPMGTLLPTPGLAQRGLTPLGLAPLVKVPEPPAFDPAAEKEAAPKLSMARRYLKEGKPRLASALLQELITAYPDTPSAILGRQLLGATATKRAEEAQKHLIRAEALVQTGSNDAARLDYQAIVERYPETPHAIIARNRLAKLAPAK
jgi:hypothetical protein